MTIGELALFVAVWILSLATALDDYAERRSDAAKNSVAASGVESVGVDTLD